MAENSNKDPMTAVLLANLGTPEAPRRAAVARFLREFLSDPRVVDLPRYLWLPLLYLVIIPLRAGRSAAAYRKIWWPEGSPLLVLTQRLGKKLAEQLAGKAVVEIGMRYGKPSIKDALERLRDSGSDSLIILPLYPQFSATTTSSIDDAVSQALEGLEWQPEVRRIDKYYDHPGWVRAVANSVQVFHASCGSAEKLVFSMHGIPQRYVANGDPYEDQCRQSIDLIVSALGLTEEEWLMSYQSRVGREPWLQPYTDITLQELAWSGVKHVQVICPGFAVDCLETLEEIAIQNREKFEAAGGEKLEYIPALNDSQEHVNMLLDLL